MEVDVNKQTLTVNKLVDTKTKNVTIEGDMIVPDVKPDILNTIDSVGNVCIYKKEVLDGKVRFDGGINVYLIYLPDSESETTRGLNTTLDFTQMIEAENCRADMDIVTSMKIKNIECNVLNGRKIKIKVELEIGLQIYSNENVEVLKEINNINNMQVLNSEMTINTLVGKGNTKAYAKDTISYDETESLAEILKAKVDIINKEIKISYNKVLVKADANMKIMYLTEDGTIKIMDSSIPVMGFIDIPDITEENVISTNYEIKNMLIKPNDNEDHSIYIEIEVSIGCMAYGTYKIELVQDMYSTNEEIDFTTKCIETEANKTNKKDIYNITEQISIPEISNSQIYDVEVNPIINNVNILNKRVVYEGEVNLNFIFASNVLKGIESKKHVLPFSYEIEDECINNKKRIITNIECIGDNFNIISDGMVECKINLQFNLEMSDSNKINLIDEINILENRESESCNMVVYIVKPEDTLWKIAKKYKTTIENIKESNNLENDTLNAGEKLYIQRCNSNTRKYIA